MWVTNGTVADVATGRPGSGGSGVVPGFYVRT